jgi:transposase-like protein
MRTKLILREVTPDEQQALEQLVHSPTAPTRLRGRAGILLGLLHGERLSTIARRLDITRPIVYTWVRRFNSHSLAGLQDRPRPGRPVGAANRSGPRRWPSQKRSGADAGATRAAHA